jgi:sec-independent protein translocase protein TatC
MTAAGPDLEQPFLSHLLELRDRILRMLLAIAIVFLVLLPFTNGIYTFVAEPLLRAMPAGTTMIATEVASPFLVPFKLTLVAAVFLAMPVILYQFWAFVAPGLYQHERKLVMPLVASSVVLFFLGTAFAYFIVFPMIFAFFQATAPEGVAVMTDINHYLDFVLTLFFAFGVAFEIPIATILLVWIGVIEPDKLKEMRPYVIVGAFVIGMFLTPPDIFSQTFLAVPMWLLFEAGVYASRFFVRGEEVAVAAAAEPAGAGAAAAVASHVPLTSEEMEAELDRIEAEEARARLAAAKVKEKDDAATEAVGADAGGQRAQALPTDPAPQAEQTSQIEEPPRGEQPSPPEDTAQVEEAAEDPTRARYARAQDKLERVMQLRQEGDVLRARQLLYEVLVEGSEDQIFVARNILNQLDTIA